MFNYDPKGDYNVSRHSLTKIIQVFDAYMAITATFSGDNQEGAYALFRHGVTRAGCFSLFDMDTGKFIVGTLDQLVEERI